MKKRIVLLIIIFAAVITIISATAFILNHHTVTFTMKDGEYTVRISGKDGKKITELSSPNGQVWLASGEYQYSVTTEKYDSSSHIFTVDSKDQSISIDPNYSQDYLKKLLSDSEYQKIKEVLQPYVDKVASSAVHTVDQLALSKRGEWASGKITLQQDRRDTPEYYRFVLHKENGDWKVIVPPQIAIYSGSYPSVPREILNSLY